MMLSVPIFKLKRQAKLQAREAGVPLHAALDQIARAEGFKAWSHLAASASARAPGEEMLARLDPGDLVLLAARPGHGKTTLSLDLLVRAVASGREGMFFTLDFTRADVDRCLAGMGESVAGLGPKFTLDTSDAITAAHVCERLRGKPAGTVAVIDYLQLLDQRRSTPPLDAQLQDLAEFAARSGVIVVTLSQVDRSFDPGAQPMPGLRDVRLPNPLDLGRFTKHCFLHDDRLQLDAGG